MNTKYLEEIAAIANDEVSAKFGFSRFDQINIHLIGEVLTKNKHFWLDVNGSDLSKFYESAIFAISVHFLEYNYCESRKILPEIGDKYQEGRKRYEVVKTGKNINGFSGTEAIKLKQRTGGYMRSLELNDFVEKFTKLDEGAGNTNRETFKPMLDFIKEILGEEENIPSFPYKFAVVAQKNDFESSFKVSDKKAFPYTYIADSGAKTKNIELAGSMFFVASSYETIKEYIFDEDIQIESIIFIGKKYDYSIQQDIDRKRFKQVIFIGEQKPDVNCLKWQWTLPEYQYFENLAQGKIEIIKVENEVLTELIEKFINHIKQLERDHYIRLQQRILPYIFYIYPLVVLAEDSRLKNRVDDLLHSFKKKSEQVLGEEFSNIGKDCTEFHQQLKIDYGVILKQFSFENNAKTRTLQQATETDYLLVPERQTIAVWQDEIQRLNWQKTKIISFSQLKKLSSPKSITILSLMDYDFYRSIRDSRHTINWLLYDVEYQRYQNFVIRYKNELIEEYKSKDRKKLTGIDYPDEIETESVDDLMDRIFDNEQPDDKEYQNSYQDHISKKIIFEDDSDVELSANSTLVLINQHNESKKYSVGDLRVGDKVRVYKNQHKEVLFRIAADADTQGKFKEILDNATLWKDRLSQYCTDNDKIVEIANKCDVADSTVNGWLHNNSTTMFPQNLGGLQDILGNVYEKIFINKKKYNSIMIALGRNLSDEVSDYIISNEKGQLLSQFNDASIKAISEHNMPIRTIKEIVII